MQFSILSPNTVVDILTVKRNADYQRTPIQFQPLSSPQIHPVYSDIYAHEHFSVLHKANAHGIAEVAPVTCIIVDQPFCRNSLCKTLPIIGNLLSIYINKNITTHYQYRMMKYAVCKDRRSYRNV